MHIPFNKPSIVGQELVNIAAAVERGQLSGDGNFTRACNQRIVDMTGAKAALLTHSCTAALEMAALLCDLVPGDEVIMPSFTFVSTANAVALRGAVPVFVDIDTATLNLDPDAVARAVTPRTKAIFAVHYAGFPADMDRLASIARAHGLFLVEDAARADVARRIAGVEGHQLFEVLENGWQHGVCPWTVVVSVVIPAKAGIHLDLASEAS